MSESDSREDVHDLAREWKEIADIDPMWAILSRPDKKHSKWTDEEFYVTGREEFDEAIALVEGFKSNFSSVAVKSGTVHLRRDFQGPLKTFNAHTSLVRRVRPAQIFAKL
jgi:hypothetical protein